MTDWPSAAFIRSASTRASASVGPPAKHHGSTWPVPLQTSHIRRPVPPHSSQLPSGIFLPVP